MCLASQNGRKLGGPAAHDGTRSHQPTFFKKLGITSTPPYAFVDELRTIAEHHQRAVPPDVQAHIVRYIPNLKSVHADIIYAGVQDAREDAPWEAQ